MRKQGDSFLMRWCDIRNYRPEWHPQWPRVRKGETGGKALEKAGGEGTWTPMVVWRGVGRTRHLWMSIWLWGLARVEVVRNSAEFGDSRLKLTWNQFASAKGKQAGGANWKRERNWGCCPLRGRYTHKVKSQRKVREQLQSVVWAELTACGHWKRKVALLHPLSPFPSQPDVAPSPAPLAFNSLL